MRGVEILLDRPRRLRFDFNALADFEKEGGRGLGTMMLEQSLAALRLAVWAGLKWEDRGLTLESAGNIIQRYIDQYEGEDSPLSYITERVSAALADSGIAAKKKNEPESTTTTRTDSASSAPTDQAA